MEICIYIFFIQILIYSSTAEAERWFYNINLRISSKGKLERKVYNFKFRGLK